MNRRQLLKRSLLLSLSPVVPSFLARTANAAADNRDDRRLVVIHLEGGNDGLNTVVPYRDESYARLRPKLHVKPDDLIKLNDEIGLHSAMKPVADLLDDGRFGIVQGVGYPISDRSHFVSMAVWYSGHLNKEIAPQYGWLGGALDVGAQPKASPHGIYVGKGAAPAALWGTRSTTATITSLKDLELRAPSKLLQMPVSKTSGELSRWVSEASLDAFGTAQRLTALGARESGLAVSPYPDSDFGEQLRLVSKLMCAGSSARVYYTVQSGYDTHSAQLASHGDLLRDFALALKAFINDLKTNQLEHRTLVFVFSEFGRRVEENGSIGTDHGAGAPVFLAGPNLARSIVGPVPDLANLDDGDVRVSIDFRRVYASILDQWMGVSSQEILRAKFEPLSLFKG